MHRGGDVRSGFSCVSNAPQLFFGASSQTRARLCAGAFHLASFESEPQVLHTFIFIFPSSPHGRALAVFSFFWAEVRLEWADNINQAVLRSCHNCVPGPDAGRASLF